MPTPATSEQEHLTLLKEPSLRSAALPPWTGAGRLAALHLKDVSFPGARMHAQLQLKAECAAVSMAAWRYLRRMLQQPGMASQQITLGMAACIWLNPCVCGIAAAWGHLAGLHWALGELGPIHLCMITTRMSTRQVAIVTATQLCTIGPAIMFTTQQGILGCSTRCRGRNDTWISSFETCNAIMHAI